MSYIPGPVAGLIEQAFIVFLLMRFGLLASTGYMFARSLIVSSPMILQASARYSGYGYVAPAIFSAIVLYAFRASLGGRPLLATSHLDD
jgi:hypothetical protein